MKTLLATLAVMLLLATGCAPSANLITADPELAQFHSIALAPVTFSTSQALANERAAIANALRSNLMEQLDRRGYAVAAQTEAPAGARLNVDITYIWDGRLYVDENQPADRLYPELRLYAKVSLTDLASGKVLFQENIEGHGPIEPVGSPAPIAQYTAPQRDLARRIGMLFPSR